MTRHAYEIELDGPGQSAALLRVVSVLHARGAEVQSLSYGRGPRRAATVAVEVVARPGGAETLARSLRRLVEVRRVTGPREVVSIPA